MLGGCDLLCPQFHFQQRWGCQGGGYTSRMKSDALFQFLGAGGLHLEARARASDVSAGVFIPTPSVPSFLEVLLMGSIFICRANIYNSAPSGPKGESELLPLMT